jgi:hypothetical protein
LGILVKIIVTVHASSGGGNEKLEEEAHALGMKFLLVQVRHLVQIRIPLSQNLRQSCMKLGNISDRIEENGEISPEPERPVLSLSRQW